MTRSVLNTFTNVVLLYHNIREDGMENIFFLKNYFSSVCGRKLLAFLTQDFLFHQLYFFYLTIQIWSRDELVNRAIGYLQMSQ